ncbi:right-handed parallel beta-helix repeat-containing protein [Exiguobacterium qingdaonense]|uniref:right-handed parallel beta-helix repeat-containing protein n=1 Tax=Exiguobacterium qingdaonense TaxID=2751251 RepID=UPI001BE79436|nr:NosD domain-containing protein [Exiguobacterium qingdaonense]
MKRLLICILFICWGQHVNAEEETIYLTEPIVIESNEHFDGRGKTYTSCNHPAFIMRGTGAVLENVSVRQCDGDQVPVVNVSGLGHQLFDVSIESSGIGVLIEESYGVRAIRVSVTGNMQADGIVLVNSQAAELIGAVVKRVRDGIYIEYGSQHTIVRPVISHSRYGVHLMFPTDVVISIPELHHNVTGAMIMGTNQVLFKNGNVHDQVGGSAMGMMLYEAVDTTVEMTNVFGNHIGIYAEQSVGTILQQNQVYGNDIGFQFKRASGMTVLQNNLLGNREAVTMVESHENIVRGNVWDGLTLDLDRDGFSEIPYRTDPYMFLLADTSEAFELLYGSPGLLLLQNILKSPDEITLTDPSPKTFSATWRFEGSLWKLSSLLLLIIIWIIGRKRHEIV